MHVATLIELAVQRLDRKSVRALSQRLGIAHGVLYEWKAGTKPIPEERILQIARIAGQDPQPWLLLIKSEQGEGELSREWGKMAKKLAAITGIAALFAAIYWTDQPTTIKEWISAMPLILAAIPVGHDVHYA